MTKKERTESLAGEMKDHAQDMIEFLVRKRDEMQAELTLIEETITRLQLIAGGNVTQSARPVRGPYRYAGLGIIEAIELYLGRKGSAASRSELRNEVITGGALVGRDERYVSGEVKKSIDYHLKADPPRLKGINAMIGLPDWPEEKFSAE